MTTDYRYEGVVNIYLQGEEALEATGDFLDHINYFVIEPESDIVIDDYRSEPAQKMRSAMIAGDDGQFAESFNRPAWVKVVATDQKARIEIYDPLGKSSKEQFELWLGSISNGKMAIRETKWELIKPVSGDRFAFVSLVK